MNSNVLTEQHLLQMRVHTGKCNFFNLIPKLPSPNIGYDSTVTYQTKKTHLPNKPGWSVCRAEVFLTEITTIRIT